MTPLGWTCISNPGSKDETILRRHSASTYFVRDQSEIEQLNANLKRFWEIEEASPLNETPIVQIRDQLAMKKVERSIQFDDNMYRTGIPFREDKSRLPDNY